MKKLVIERTFDAPIEKVWEAWTSVEMLKRWWSPPGMTNTSMTAEVKEGGKFLYCFKSDEDGKEYWGRGIYQKLEEPHYLSYLDSFTDEKGNDVGPGHYGMGSTEVMETLVEITLTEKDGKTHMKLEGENPFDEEMTKGMTEGWNGMFDKLGASFKG
jgi:uncharacterized protein YndB with AHSA1/START domain